MKVNYRLVWLPYISNRVRKRQIFNLCTSRNSMKSKPQEKGQQGYQTESAYSPALQMNNKEEAWLHWKWSESMTSLKVGKLLGENFTYKMLKIAGIMSSMDAYSISKPMKPYRIAFIFPQQLKQWRKEHREVLLLLPDQVWQGTRPAGDAIASSPGR